MVRSTSARDGARKSSRGAFAYALALLSAFAILLGFAAPANASLTGSPFRPGSVAIVTDDGSADLTLWERARVEGTLDFPDTAREGDRFTLALPPIFAPALGVAFAIDSTTSPVVPIANCVTATTPSGMLTTCTLTDYFTPERGAVTGVDFWQTIHVQEVTEETTVDIAVDGGVVYTVPLPGDSGIGYPLPPSTTQKWGVPEAAGTVSWTIAIPGDEVIGFDPVVVTDRLLPAGADTEGHTYLDVDFSITMVPTSGGAPVPAVPTFSQVIAPNGTDATFTSAGALDPAYVYMFSYRTEPDETALIGDRFRNEADVMGRELSATVEFEAAGGGQGGAELLGRFSLRKQVTAVDGAAVPADAEYGIEYTIGDDPTVRTMSLTAGGTEQFSTRAPAGSVYRVREAVTPVVSGVASWMPVFTVDGTALAPDASGWVSVSPGAGQVVAVTLTNTPVLAPGSFTLEKLLASDAAALAGGETYTVTYSYGDPAVSGTVELTVGEVSDPVEVPAGSLVTVQEIDLPDPAALGLQPWSTPVFSGEGVADDADGTAVFTVGASADVAVSVTNSASGIVSIAPVTAPPVVLPAPTATPTALALTGGAGLGPVVTCAVLGTVLGALLLGARRRRDA